MRHASRLRSRDRPSKRYEALADEIEASIRAGTLRAGDRLPSVRQAAASRGVHASTVFQAYYRLEARGLIRAQARSGYYVAAVPPPELEHVSAPEGESIAVDVGERVFAILRATMRRDVVPLGSAFPSPLLFPLTRLARTMAATVQRLDPRASVDHLHQGNAALRRQIALRYLVDGLAVDAEDLVVTNGAMEALHLALAAVTKPGDAVVVESPTFYAALQALEQRGLRAIEVATHPREGIELGALADVLERQRPAACWLMTNFQNPLGSLMPEAKKRELVELLARHDTPLIEDDVYGELYFGARRPPPAKAYDRAGLVLHCSSFSKCLAPGYRIGWIAPGRHLATVARLKLSTTLTASTPAEATIAAYLEHGGYDRHLRKLRRALAQQRDAMLAAIARHFPAATRATRPEGGYFLWLELPPGAEALDLHRRALAQSISVAPGPIFSSRARFERHLRLNCGHPHDERIEAALATLGRLATLP
ncbi:DNA-binding transcriptional MocR family regulator [Dokdonella fugitiva]|uniref:DNA-binding transcriptional MocR family regulator n=1 Tax=Dokdonella fugitiva TaxID=328517 RepID=A0A839F5W8_9GAMM|nr:PLP-dependent aminotransferase family protein [Dokdonella fugitiva]MBA8889462.1 DNA-binding transcriptional MocR family regulator [Dokdonella fugitiva]